MFTLNLFLMLAWVIMSGQYTLGNLLFGFLLGYAVMWVVLREGAQRRYLTRITKVLRLLIFFLWELLKANARLTYDILTPTHHMRPAIIAFPLEVHSEVGIMLLATLVTLTPGTLSIDVSEDRRVLFIHAMYVEDAEKEIMEIKNGFERRVREVVES